ncbi:MAG: hypothetical protein ACYC5M_12040 [Anaerolineae bacterium]
MSQVTGVDRYGHAIAVVMRGSVTISDVIVALDPQRIRPIGPRSLFRQA